MTAFDDWLGAMRLLATTPTLTAMRGSAFAELIEIDGDWTGSTLQGAIRLTPDAPDPTLADFVITGPTVTDGVSAWSVSLASATTTALPADSDLDGKAEFPCAFHLTPSGGTNEPLFGGTFLLIGKV